MGIICVDICKKLIKEIKMKANKKILALGLAGVLLTPNLSQASSAQEIINELYDGMDAISGVSGLEKVDRPASSYVTGGKTTTVTTTTTTVVKSGSVKVEDQKKAEKNAAEATALKKVMESNLAQADAALMILKNYPNTVKGYEEELVNLITEGHAIRLRAAAEVKALTGEVITVTTPEIPEAYKHLIRL